MTGFDVYMILLFEPFLIVCLSIYSNKIENLFITILYTLLKFVYEDKCEEVEMKKSNRTNAQGV